jgi:hypothetical protein
VQPSRIDSRLSCSDKPLPAAEPHEGHQLLVVERYRPRVPFDVFKQGDNHQEPTRPGAQFLRNGGFRQQPAEPIGEVLRTLGVAVRVVGGVWHRLPPQ